MEKQDHRPPSVCVIGAGCSGITAVKNLVQAGISNVVCFEKGEQIGGNWVFSEKESHSSVCETTHIISSRKMSEYLDFPMPDHYPDYPSHEQVLAYFQSYAAHFDIEKYIRFGKAVVRAHLQDDLEWIIQLDDGTTHRFDYLLVANGHHNDPRHPDWKDRFTGRYLHAHSYKSNRSFKGERVLVVGAGNSGCDCAVEISRTASFTAISMRRAYYIIPKFMMGKPTDTYNRHLTLIPKWLRGKLQKLSLRISIGRYTDYGLEEPDYPITRCHPTLNSELLYKIRHGKVEVRKGIREVDGHQVTFADGISESYDTIVAATGYKITFPFFDPEFLDFENREKIPLYLRMFHPDHSRLIFIGLTQPQGAIWPLSDLQAKLAANYIAGRWQRPANIRDLAEKEAESIRKEFLKVKRHALEVHYHDFRSKLQGELPANIPEWQLSEQSEPTGSG